MVRPTAKHAGDDIVESQQRNAAPGGEVRQDEGGLLHLSLDRTQQMLNPNRQPQTGSWVLGGTSETPAILSISESFISDKHLATPTYKSTSLS